MSRGGLGVLVDGSGCGHRKLTRDLAGTDMDPRDGTLQLTHVGLKRFREDFVAHGQDVVYLHNIVHR